MRAKILKWGLLATALVGFTILFFQYARQSPRVMPFNLTRVQKSTGAPVRIKIPAIGVNAAIEQVAETPDGFMDVPSLPLNTAWYKLGPRPGEKGSAVIDGHVNWKGGAKAVFLDLHKLKPGDKVSVQDDQGSIISFVVRESRNYEPNAYASDVFASNDGKAHLNLITCEGTWDKVAKNYSGRLVVFTDKER